MCAFQCAFLKGKKKRVFLTDLKEVRFLLDFFKSPRLASPWDKARAFDNYGTSNTNRHYPILANRWPYRQCEYVSNIANWIPADPCPIAITYICRTNTVLNIQSSSTKPYRKTPVSEPRMWLNPTFSNRRQNQGQRKAARGGTMLRRVGALAPTLQRMCQISSNNNRTLSKSIK